jgi:AAA domain
MNIKDIAQFRQYIKKTSGRENDNSTDENFVGSYYQQNGTITKGFFEIYHGRTKNIRKWLRANAVNIAADEQAIYEFMQNAVDCGSTHFFIFYNDDYFLVINNGNQFQINDVDTILNIGQSEKGNAEIGSYGIGFKIVHRLVGENDGVDELTNEYKGPILFSWSNLNDFKALINNQEIETISEQSNSYDKAPWLFKILLTNFPTQPGEFVKDQTYINKKVLFTNEELSELIEFVNLNLKNHKNNFKFNILNEGSLFFLKLGKGKRKYLDNNKKELERGVGYSLNTLKNLQKVYINDAAVGKPTLQLINDIVIKQNTDEFLKISPENRDRDINVIFGYYADFEQSKEILTAPNFYNFFPMESEINEFRFIIHCNAFDNRANRRELHKSEINERLLNHIITKILNRIDQYKTKDADRERFLQVYLSLLLSKIPQEDTKWLLEPFFNHILDYIKKNIPTLHSYKDNPKNVIVKSTELNVSLKNFGIVDKEWFYFNDLEVTIEARKETKLGLKSWTIVDLLYFGDLTSINKWFKLNSQLIPRVFKELNLNWSSRGEYKNFADKFREIKLFKFKETENLLSIADIASKDKYLFKFDKISEISTALQKIGFKISEINISDFSKQGNNNFETSLRGFLKLNNFDLLFEKINSFCTSTPLQNITDKNKLFNAITSDPKEFIDSKHFSNIQLYQNKQGDVLPLNRLISDKSIIDENSWLTQFMIEDINNPQVEALISSFSCKEENIYSEIICPNWLTIIDIITKKQSLPVNFYSNIIGFYDNRINKTTQNHISASGNAYIWTGKEFANNDNIIFTEYFWYEDISLGNLKSLLQKWFNLSIPDKEIIHILSEPPFKTEHYIKFKTDTECKETFTSSEITELLKWNRESSLQFFRYYYITEYLGEYAIKVKEEEINQYYTDDESIIKFLDSKSGYILLQRNFAKYTTDEVLTNSKLYEKLITLIDFDNIKTDVFDIFRKAELKEQSRFIDELHQITLNINLLPQFDSYEYELLKFACEVQVENIPSIQEKITIETILNTYRIETTTVQAETFEIDKYELSLSKLLLLDISEKSNAIYKTIEHFENLMLSEERLLKLFNVESEYDNEVINTQIRNSIIEKGNICQNAEQLVFCIVTEFSEGQVEMKSEDVYNIFEYNSYCPDSSFQYLNPNSVLSEKYMGLSEILEINNDNPYYIIKEGIGILLKPYFDKNIFNCPYFDFETKSEIDNYKRLFLLNQVFLDYKSIKNKYSSIEINEIDINKLFEFEPSKSVYPHQFGIEDECIEKWLSDWINSDENEVSEKEEFISYFGINTLSRPNNSIVNFRKNLSGTINEIYQKQDNIFFLKNTLQWLFENEIELGKSQAKLLVNIYENLSANFDNPFTVHKNLDNEIYEAHKVEQSDFYVNESTISDFDSNEISISEIFAIINEKKPKNDLIPAIPAFFPSTYINFIETNLVLVEISEPQPDENLILNPIEWSVDFYNGIKNELSHSIYLVSGNIPTICTFLDAPVKSGFDADISIGTDKIYINKSNFITPEQILTLLKGHSDLVELYNHLFEQKNEIAVRIGNTLIERGLSENDMNSDIINKAIQSINTQQVNSILPVQYTYGWFKYWLEIQASISRQSTKKDIEITFTKVKVIDSNTIRISRPKAAIPEYIESFAVFNAEIVATSMKSDVLCRSVQYIDINTLEVKFNPIYGVSNDIYKITIRASKFDELIGNLFDKFVELCEHNSLIDEEEISLPPAPFIEFVFGPPGTGKTYWLVEKIEQLLKENARILVLTPTNSAADNIIERLLKKDLTDVELVRFGNCHSDEIYNQGAYIQSGGTINNQGGLVFSTTMVRFPFDKFTEYRNRESESHFIRNEMWDYVVLDEASMISLSYVAYSILQSSTINSDCKYYIAGDPFQIQPIVKVNYDREHPHYLQSIIWEKATIYEYVDLKDFNPEISITGKFDYTVHNLKRQFRSLAAIGQLYSSLTYNGYLEHERQNKPQKQIYIGGNDSLKYFRPINLLTVPFNTVGVFNPQKVDESAYQPYLTVLISELLSFVVKHIEETMTIGVICPHRTQADVISKLLDKYSIPANIDLRINTVHKSQGCEYDAVFALLFHSKAAIIPSYNQYAEFAFINNLNIINVAISRAQDYLFIVVPDKNTERIEHFKLLEAAGGIRDILANETIKGIGSKLKDEYMEIPAEEFEQLMFNQKNYIDFNTLVSQHDLINVYAEIEEIYSFYHSESSVDAIIDKQKPIKTKKDDFI